MKAAQWNARAWRLALLMTLAVVTSTSAAQAQDLSPAQLKRQAQAEFDADICAQRTGSAVLDIITCTRAIKLGKHSALTLATLHNSRGNAYRITGRTDKALTDHSAAIAANPLSAEAHLGRALARVDSGELVGATDDLDRAIALSPRLGFAWKHRGRIAFLQGDDQRAKHNLDQALVLNDADGEAFAFRALVAFRDGRFSDAIADFEASEARQVGYMYTPLWIYLAAAHLGRHDVATLDDGLWSLQNDDQWPGILIRSYRKETTAHSVLQRARQAPGRYADKRVAEAAFYLGQLALVDGDAAKAATYFVTVEEKALPNSVERAMLP